MQFNSIAYVLFLPIVFLLYWWLPFKYRNVLLVLASFVFYGTWSWMFLGLMVLTGAVNWGAACSMERVSRRKPILIAALLFNFLILGVFKYCNFFIENFVELLNIFGLSVNAFFLDIILPVGISFYTFQVSGYITDVYQRKQPAVYDIWHFFAFLSFFPQLVAGPIEQSQHLLPQLKKVHEFDYATATSGMRLILWGLMKKMLLADNCGNVADMIFRDYQSCTSLELWVGAIFFAFQIYGDFSGYTDMAIGSAKLFGIQLTKNFHIPYLSTSIPDFWRNWHISLMMWFRNYVYIPLGGNKQGRLKKWRNIYIVFALSGLWHGASWTYVVWGLYHATLFIPYSLRWLREAQNGLFKGLQIAVTFTLVCIGWIFFRSQNMTQAWGYLQGLADTDNMLHYGYSRMPLLLVAVFFLVEYLCKGNNPLDFKCGGVLKYKAVRFALYFLLFLGTLYWGGEPARFIYFQF